MRKAAVTSQIYLDDETQKIIQTLKANKVNISHVCREALKAAHAKLKAESTDAV